MPLWFGCRVAVAYTNLYNVLVKYGTLKASAGIFLQFQWHTVIVLYMVTMFRKMGEIKELLNSLLDFNRDAACKPLLHHWLFNLLLLHLLTCKYCAAFSDHYGTGSSSEDRWVSEFSESFNLDVNRHASHGCTLAV